MSRFFSVTLALAVSVLLGLGASAGADSPGIDRLENPPVERMGALLGPGNRTETKGTSSVDAVQLVRADFFDSSMARHDETVRRQMAALVKKHKSSSDIGYPATAKVTDIYGFQIIDKNGDVYSVNIRYQVVASVDTATFEDVFIVELGSDGAIKVLDLVQQ